MKQPEDVTDLSEYCPDHGIYFAVGSRCWECEGLPAAPVSTERMAALKTRKKEYLDSQQPRLGVGDWYDPSKYSPSQILRALYFDLVAELVPEALTELRTFVLPAYQVLVSQGVLHNARGSLCVRDEPATMRDLIDEPANLVLALTLVTDAESGEKPKDEQSVNTFLAQFEDWCWRFGFLDKWTWNRPLGSLYVWAFVCPPDPEASDNTEKWAESHLGARKSVVYDLGLLAQPELVDRETFMRMVNEQYDAMETDLEARGMVRRPAKRAAKGAPDDRHLRWLVRYQVAGETQESILPDNRTTVQSAIRDMAEELRLTRRSRQSSSRKRLGREDWSLLKVVSKDG